VPITSRAHANIINIVNLLIEARKNTQRACLTVTVLHATKWCEPAPWFRDVTHRISSVFEFVPKSTASSPQLVEKSVKPSAGRPSIDLRAASWVSPYMLCLIPVLISNVEAVSVDFSTASNDAARYASRMHLGSVLDELGVAHCLPTVRESDRSNRLVELTSFSAGDTSAPEKLTQLMQERCDLNGVPADVADEIAGHIYELCNNTVAHAACETAWLCAQSYQQSRLEFVVADAGRGIRASLAGTEFECENHADSITTAVRRRTSSIGRPMHHGVGLSSVLNYTQEMSGMTAVRSGDAIVQFAGASYAASTLELSGTIVGCSIRFPH